MSHARDRSSIGIDFNDDDAPQATRPPQVLAAPVMPPRPAGGTRPRSDASRAVVTPNQRRSDDDGVTTSSLLRQKHKRLDDIVEPMSQTPTPTSSQPDTALGAVSDNPETQDVLGEPISSDDESDESNYSNDSNYSSASDESGASDSSDLRLDLEMLAMWDVDPVKAAEEFGVDDVYIEELRDHVDGIRLGDEEGQQEEEQYQSDEEDLARDREMLMLWDTDSERTARDYGVDAAFIEELRDHVNEAEHTV
eukprot:COSAG01_NODE_5834_length_4006_cov_2.108267_3_plen_251_part_00